ncbi:estradiol 17-beta-dehydrogenase 11 [Culex quinquefasciatus]|uniref:estradiol 17-beta-dehydrogenase 11 n=1 Tax=Culex quinquefasciatus TaxID=7176 RepID=UPI0018E2E424|nr:estradiol 17-beta-dehydrogenase 11 [Culex quinquefasciatus]
MQSLRNIGGSPYEAAPRGDTLLKLRDGSGSGSDGLATVKFVLSCLIDAGTFLVLLVPILVKYVVGLFVSPPKKDIRGQLALVTGGSNGLGREICFQLARNGCHVAVVDLDSVNGEKTVQDLHQQYGVKAMFYKADISSYESVQELRKSVESSLGQVDILVNNAGVMPLMSVREGTPEDLKRVLEINLLSHFWTIRTFIDGMVSRRKGHIVAVASAVAYLPLGRLCSYVASKYGVRGLMEAFNDELYCDGLQNEVFTTTVNPIFLNTRKDLIDALDKANLLGRMPIFSAKTMARAVVGGMLRNRQDVFVPKAIKPFLIQYENIPNEIKRLARRIMLRTDMPKLMD